MVSCECQLDWQIENLAVCVSPHTMFTDTLLFSSSFADGAPVCDAARSFPQPVPKMPWSTQRISSMCTGSGTLVLRVRQGKAEEAKSSDCIIAEQSVSFDYSEADQPLKLPDTNAWSAQDQACARAYEEAGGYLEFRVESQQLGCGKNGVSVKYVNQCPVGCDLDPDQPKCEPCGKESLTNSF